MKQPVRRVVFATSTLVSAALRPGSIPHGAVSRALAQCEVCASAQTWLELERVLKHRKFDRYLGREARAEFAGLLRLAMHFFAVTPDDDAAVNPPCRDAKDNKFLALAQVCQANAIVSSDDDLRVLDPWCGIPVLGPANFLSRIDG